MRGRTNGSGDTKRPPDIDLPLAVIRVQPLITSLAVFRRVEKAIDEEDGKGRKEGFETDVGAGSGEDGPFVFFACGARGMVRSANESARIGREPDRTRSFPPRELAPSAQAGPRRRVS